MPFVRSRYPADWPAISRRIRDRAAGLARVRRAQFREAESRGQKRT